EDLLIAASEAGAEDINEEGDFWEVTCPPESLQSLRSALEEAGVSIESSQVSMVPNSTVPLDSEMARKVLKLMEDLEDADDVQEVYSNFDVPDEVLEEVASGA
ncbi:MAG: YebC/PmpR family DNA-binding transcriptional regulator, partial [Actinomycetota bacterium]